MNDLDDFPPESKPFRRPSARWIAISTDIVNHPIVGLAATKGPWSSNAAWLWLLLEACHRSYAYDVRGRVIQLKRGQLVLSERYLARKVNWTRKAAISWVAKLVRNGMISIETTRPNGQLTLDFSGTKRGPTKGPTLTIVTICNYDVYQMGPRTEGASQGATKGPVGGHYPTSDNRQDRTPSVPLESGGSVFDAREEAPSGTDGAVGDRLPFSEDVVRLAAELDLNVEDLIAKYHRQAKKEAARGKPIRDPSAYLHKMTVDAFAKMQGITVDQVRRLISRNKRESITEMANVVGAFSKPSPQLIERARRRMDPNVDQALANLAKKTFKNQAAADRAFDGELAVLRFRGRAAS